MVGKADIGVAGPPFEFRVELGKVREFARAIKGDIDAYLSGDEPVSPPTFTVVAGRLWGYTFDAPGDTSLADVDIDRSLLLHANEEYEFFGPPPRAGDVLQVSTRVADVFEKEGRRGGKLIFIVAETDFKRPDGERAMMSRTTVVKTEAAPEKEE